MCCSKPWRGIIGPPLERRHPFQQWSKPRTRLSRRPAFPWCSRALTIWKYRPWKGSIPPKACCALPVTRKLYWKLLRQFSVQQSGAPGQITELLKSGDRPAAERTAHTVKGVAGNLGVKTVQVAAGELEKAIHDGADAARLEPLRQQFATVLTPFVHRLRAALGEEPVSPAAPKAMVVDPAQLKLVVEQMTRHLAEFDAAASDCLEANRCVFASLFSAEEFGKFEQQVQGYAFGAALAQLKRAARLPRV